MEGGTQATLGHSYPGPRLQGTFRARRELVHLQTTHRNQPNHQGSLGPASEGQRSFSQVLLKTAWKSREEESAKETQPAARQCGSVSAGCSEPCQVPPVSPPQSPHQPHEVRVLLCPLHGQGQRIHVYGDRGPRKSGAGFPQPPNVPHGCIFSGLAPSGFNSILKSALTQESLIQLSLLR